MWYQDIYSVDAVPLFAPYYGPMIQIFHSNLAIVDLVKRPLEQTWEKAQADKLGLQKIFDFAKDLGLKVKEIRHIYYIFLAGFHLPLENV